MHSVSILGCGWLGLPLGVALKKLGFLVKGSTTHEEKLPLLHQHGIEPHVFDLSVPYESGSHFLDSEILIIAVPPKTRLDGGEQYKRQIHHLAATLKETPIRKVILISTTAVYPNTNSIVTEEQALPEHPLVVAERYLMESQDVKTAVLRFGGLIGPGRHPGRFFAGKTEVDLPDAPVNLISRNDCIHVITSIIDRNAWHELFNACADEHPSRREFYIEAAQLAGLEAPTFTNDRLRGKIINCDKIKARLGITFTNLHDTLRQLTASE
ncbi:MAG TPA: SDR family oxidoreductase [Chryseosolibacter sp.]|nr:SDR family oxidoreductase [Chryseosolibacter sp.]